MGDGNMKNYIRSALIAFGATVALGAASTDGAHASIMYNQDLASPGVYFGSGNSNGDWAVNTVNLSGVGDVELGLRAKIRQGSLSPSDSNGIYGSFPEGLQPNHPTTSTWNYEFSVRVPNTETLTDLATNNYTVQLCASDGTNTGCVDPLTFWTDNAFVTPSGSCGYGPNTPKHPCSYDPTLAYGNQNSENLLFLASPLTTMSGNPYNPYAPGLYNFTLSVLNSTGDPVAQTEIAARVPEPATLALFGVGLACMGFMWRKRAA